MWKRIHNISTFGAVASYISVIFEKQWRQTDRYTHTHTNCKVTAITPTHNTSEGNKIYGEKGIPIIALWSPVFIQ